MCGWHPHDMISHRRLSVKGMTGMIKQYTGNNTSLLAILSCSRAEQSSFDVSNNRLRLLVVRLIHVKDLNGMQKCIS